MSAITATRSGYVVVGVDTHKHLHVDAVAGILATMTIPTDTGGFKQLLAGHAYRVLEAGCPDRRLRRMHGKTDTRDAENAARAVLPGMATATPKSADGVLEMIRQLKIVHDTAVEDPSSTLVTLKVLLVHGADTLRVVTNRMTQIKLARHLAALGPRELTSPAESLRFALRSLVRRWLGLDTEITTLEQQLNQLIRQRCPELLQRFGIGTDTAAEILIVAGDNPERITSEVAFTKMAGISPVPTGSGLTSGQHRINHGGHRQLNAAITVIVRMQHHEPTNEPPWVLFRPELRGWNYAK